MPKYKFDNTRVLSDSDVRGMIAGASQEGGALIAFLYEWGPRISEALLVTREDVKLGPRHVIVDLLTLKTRKSQKPRRRIARPMKSEFVRFFSDYVMKLPSPNIREDLSEHRRVFPFKRGKAWMIIKKADPLASPHLFRHTRASQEAEKKGDAYRLSRFFGWRNLNTSLAYVHSRGVVY